MDKSNLSDMNTAIINCMFTKMAEGADNIEEIAAGNISISRKILQVRDNLIADLNESKFKDSVIWIFIGKVLINKKPIFCIDTTDMMPPKREFAISIDDNWLGYTIEQASVSGKMLTFIDEYHG